MTSNYAEMSFHWVHNKIQPPHPSIPKKEKKRQIPSLLCDPLSEVCGQAQGIVTLVILLVSLTALYVWKTLMEVLWVIAVF